jgi:hypothetical protein
MKQIDEVSPAVMRTNLYGDDTLRREADLVQVDGRVVHNGEDEVVFGLRLEHVGL